MHLMGISYFWIEQCRRQVNASQLTMACCTKYSQIRCERLTQIRTTVAETQKFFSRVFFLLARPVVWAKMQLGGSE